MYKFLKSHLVLFLNLTVIICLFVLPYYLFQGKLYISGDDTRLFYAYPLEYFKEFTFSSWHHFSSVGANTATQFMIPFLLEWSLLHILIPSRTILSYLGFSLPLILGFIFLEAFIDELIGNNKENLVSFLGSLFFITSPIISINQIFIFLSTIWLLPLIPLSSLLFLRYLKTGNFKYVLFGMIAWISLSLALFSIPWFLGFVLPFFGAIILVSFFSKIKNKPIYIKRGIIMMLILIASQSFWLLSFIMTYFGRTDIDFGSKILSKGVADTFTPTVLATASGNIFYPLLNLFHRQITVDFGWDLRHIFYNFYDKTIALDFIFVFILFSGIFLYKKHLSEKQNKIYLVFLISFIFTLFLYTVNIGPLKNLFLIFGNIPGFVMFRNFFDKFALSFVMFYAILLSFSFEAIKKFNKKMFTVVTTAFIFVILFNFSQIGNIINAPLWQTENVGRNIKIPKEYLEFMKEVGKKIPSTNNIFTVPFGTALYSVIKDENSDNVYTGTSPVKLFSGVNDISGFLSFYFSDARGIIEYLIINRDYVNLKKMLNAYNVNYVFVNTNIPSNVKDSWVFDKRMNKTQDSEFLKNIAYKEPIIVSSNGNYKIYKLKDINTLLVSKDLTYKKINETKFKMYFNSLKDKQKLIFSDSFQSDWKIFIVKNPTKKWCTSSQKIGNVFECKEQDILLEGNELNLIFKNPIFNNTHKAYSKYLVNEWVVDPEYIKNNFGKDFYSQNKDGSINAEFILYFTPQNYFYTGAVISLIVVLGVISYLVFISKNKFNKNEKK